MEQHNGCDSINSTITSRAPTPLGTLEEVPLELRRLIYEPLFKASSVAITRVSKTMNEDTKASLLEHGVYHITIAPAEDYKFKCLIAGVATKSSTPVIPTHVQNLALNFLPDYSLGGWFDDKMQEPRLCAIVNGIVVQLGKKKYCHLTFGVADQTMRVVLALEVLRNFECAYVIFEGVSKPICKWHNGMHAMDIWREDRNCVEAALGQQSESQGGPKTSLSHTIWYLGQDHWLRCLRKTNGNDCVLFRLFETQAYNVRQTHNPSSLSDDEA